MTASTSLRSSCGTLPSASVMQCAARSDGRVMLKEPRCDLARGVRELATTTASLMAGPLLGSSPQILRPVAAAGKSGSARQARGLGAGGLDLLDGLRGAGGEVLDALGGDQDVVFDADADAAELRWDRVGDGRRLGLLLLFERLGRGHAEAQPPLPHLLLAVLAEVEGHALARGVDVDPGLDREDHAGLEGAGLPAHAVVADIVHVHAEPVPGAVHEELAVVVHGQ